MKLAFRCLGFAAAATLGLILALYSPAWSESWKKSHTIMMTGRAISASLRMPVAKLFRTLR